MNDTNKKKAGWKQKVIHEMIEYYINFLYLAIFFAVFAWYRRLILAEYQISYSNYGIAVIKALVLAKIITLRSVLCPGCGTFEERRLIFPTLYKAFLFTVWTGVFTLIEHTVRGFLYGKGLAGGLDELVSQSWHELAAGCLVIFFVFIPFFAVRELGQVLGEGRISKLFFQRRSTMKPGFDSEQNSPENCRRGG